MDSKLARCTYRALRRLARRFDLNPERKAFLFQPSCAATWSVPLHSEYLHDFRLGPLSEVLARECHVRDWLRAFCGGAAHFLPNALTPGPSLCAFISHRMRAPLEGGAAPSADVLMSALRYLSAAEQTAKQLTTPFPLPTSLPDTDTPRFSVRMCEGGGDSPGRVFVAHPLHVESPLSGNVL
eukprot:gene45339-55475_t